MKIINRKYLMLYVKVNESVRHDISCFLQYNVHSMRIIFNGLLRSNVRENQRGA